MALLNNALTNITPAGSIAVAKLLWNDVDNDGFELQTCYTMCNTVMVTMPCCITQLLFRWLFHDVPVVLGFQLNSILGSTDMQGSITGIIRHYCKQVTALSVIVHQNIRVATDSLGGKPAAMYMGMLLVALSCRVACSIHTHSSSKSQTDEGKPAARWRGVLQASSRLSTEIPALMRVSRTCVCPKAAA